MRNEKTSFNDKLKKITESILVRLQLLKLWFIKNITVFIKLIIIIGVILVLCGIADNTIPIIGEISDEVKKIVTANSWQIIVKCLGTAASIFISVYTFTKKTKRLVIEDIKSKKLKIALIKANLYFDEAGRLRKRPKVEKVDFEDTYDVGLSNLSNSPKENLVEGVVRASSELGLILTTDIKTGNDEDKILQDAQLTENNQEASSENTETVNSQNEEETVKTRKKKNVFAKIFNPIKLPVKKYMANVAESFKSMKDPKLEKIKTKKKKEVKEETEEKEDNVEIVNNTNVILENEENTEVIQTEVKNEKPEEPISIQPVPSAVKTDIVTELTTEQKISKQKNTKKINDILSSLK